MASIFLATQYIFYGSLFGSGYAVPQANGAAGNVLEGIQGISFFKSLFLPFGFDVPSIAKTAFYYIVQFPFLFFVLSLLGIVSFIYKKYKKQEIENERNLTTYIIVFSCIAVYVCMKYGSWSFYDNLIHRPTIATSYTRYFLPVYVFALPFVIFGIYALTKWIRNKKIRFLGISVIVITIFSWSFYEYNIFKI